MRILSWDDEPLARVVYLRASPSGGVESAALAVERAFVDALPAGLDALVATSDLQGIVTDWSAGGIPVLLGEHLADVLIDLADQGAIPSPSRTGALLAGDLFSAPDASERGASGDVTSVWEAFAQAFRWVAGVQGNHDRFGKKGLQQKDGHLLDGEVVELDGLRVGGVGLITGNPDKPGRRSEPEFLGLLDAVLARAPDVVVLHEGPRGSRRQRGNEAIREALLGAKVGLSLCGHCHWDEALAEPQPSTQFLNVDGRAVVLQPQS